MIRTNKDDRKILKSLVKGLAYLNAGIIESKESDYNFGLEIIENWLKKNPDFFDTFCKEIMR